MDKILNNVSEQGPAGRRKGLGGPHAARGPHFGRP